MNILPLVITFLMIFSYLTFSFLREVQSFSLFETAIHSYHRTHRVLNNAIARKAYRKIKTEPSASKQAQPKKTSSADYHSMRALFPPLDSSKFHLAPLLKQEGEFKQHPLYEPLAELFRLLYGKRLFAKEKNASKIEYRLIDEILKNAKKNPEAKRLSELFPQDLTLKKIYYKMVRGTNRYDREEGIPPLDHFVSLEKAEKTVALGFASPLILEALFSKEIACDILSFEKKKWEESNVYYYFSKEDFPALLMKNPSQAMLIPSLDPYLGDSKQLTPRNTLAGRDNLTGIAVELTIN